jgi:cytochrome c peroxidase
LSGFNLALRMPASFHRTHRTSWSCRALLRQCLLLSTAAALLGLAGCGSGPEKPIVDRISALQPVPHPQANPATPAKLALGKQLFADVRMSDSGRSACVSCHARHLGWADGKVVSVRADGQPLPRHTASLYNLAWQTRYGWDGRSATLEDEVLLGWREHVGADPAAIVALLNAIPGYAGQFQAVWGGPATPQNVAQSIAAYLRTKTSENAPWDRYERGDVKAVSPEAIEGFKLFAGKGNCTACHAPPLYGNGNFYNAGLEAGKRNPDPGRFGVTQQAADRGAFKTPSLRSVALSGPYFHDGSARTLREAVAVMAAGGKRDRHKSPLLKNTGLSNSEIDKVVAFLTSLTSGEAWQPPALP